MNRFVFVSLFLVPFFAQALPTITLSGYGEGTGAIVMVDTKIVQQMIPEGLELIQSADSQSGTHPVTFLFATQKNLSMLSAAGTIPLAKEYKEIILLVQNVRIKGGNRIYSYFKKLYLDNVAAIVGGWYISYPKSYAKFEFQDGHYIATSVLGKPLISTDFHMNMDFDPVKFSDTINDLQISLRDVVADKFGVFQCSRFTYDMTQSQSAPIFSQWNLSAKFNEHLAGQYDLPSLDQSRAGGFILNAPWTLVGPIDCE